MSIIKDLPGYEELFGALDFKKGDEARSVYSPAAYLADLLQLIDDFFENADHRERRPDIDNIRLDGENTFTPLPYLDIVIELLEKAAEADGKDAYTVLREALYPFNLPFSLDNEKLKKYLHFLNVSPQTLYKLFSLRENPDRVSRDYLGLSEEEYRLITQPKTVDRQYLDTYFDYDTKADAPGNFPAATFLKLTGLSGNELRELLFVELSDTARNSAEEPEKERADELYINAGLGGYARLDDGEEKIIWSSAGAAIPLPWFDRVNRFIRLAKKTGLSFTDLDLVLRSCCGNTLDHRAVQTIAVVKQLQVQTDLEMNVVCALLCDINTLGIGNEEQAQDLFNRVFNNRFADVSKNIISAYPDDGAANYLPAGYSHYTQLSVNGDLLSMESKDFRRRLGSALQISEKQLTSIVQKFRSRISQNGSTNSLLASGAKIELPALSLLYRVSKLSEILDISYSELFFLFDLFEKDPSIHKFSNFPILVDAHPEERDCYRIIAGGDTPASLWLIQMLFAVVQWMKSYDFTAEELKKIIISEYAGKKEAQAARAQKIGFLNNLYQQFKPVMLNEALFTSQLFDARSSRAIHRVVSGSGAGLTSPGDNRLLKYEQAPAEQAAYRALTSLEQIHADDFTGLGLEQKILDKIFNNLILKGYLDLDGRIIETAFPAKWEDFSLAADFSDYQKPLFEIMREIHLEETQSESDPGAAPSITADDLIDYAVYESDLSELALPPARLSELYDNLIFNGYLDEEGNMLQPAFFADPDNHAKLLINTPIAAYAEQVFQAITRQTGRFEAEDLAVKKEIFADLPLKEIERDDLMENLRFNGYLDKENLVVNKASLLNTAAKDFNLALGYYPYRHQILKALQSVIGEFKVRFYTLSEESLSALAETLVSQLIYDLLKGEYCPDGRIKPEKKAFFRNRHNRKDFRLAAYFDPAANEAVFDAVWGFLAAAEKYQLTEAALEELGLDAGMRAEIFEDLADRERILPNGMIPAEKLSYFLNINQALQFVVEGFEDYSKDIFFALHNVARETDAAIKEIGAKLEQLSRRQEEVLWAALQEVYELPAGIVNVICGHVFRNPAGMVEE